MDWIVIRYSREANQWRNEFKCDILPHDIESESIISNHYSVENYVVIRDEPNKERAFDKGKISLLPQRTFNRMKEKTLPVREAGLGASVLSGRDGLLGRVIKFTISRALEKTGYHQARAAELLGISPRVLCDKIDLLKIRLPDEILKKRKKKRRTEQLKRYLK